MGLIARYKYERENKRPADAFKSMLQAGIDRLLGIDRYKELNETLYYFLNQYCDITTVPAATGALRALQLCDLELHRIIDIVCKKYNLTYWLDFGTLLGAVRHKGFIPWDDDLDIGMPRKDYMKLNSVLDKELGKYGFEHEDVDIMCRIGYGYKETKTGVKIDVFPIDECQMEETSGEAEKILKKRILKFRRFYNIWRKNTSIKKMEELKKKIITDNGDNTFIYHGPEFRYPTSVVIHDKKDIYPIRIIEFEGIKLFCPNDPVSYLKKIYGNYMDFPRSGGEHHMYRGVKMSEFAEFNGVNMDAIRNELIEIIDVMKSGDLT